MKKLTIGLTLAATILFQNTGVAGTERGGGNLLEAAFATAINQIEIELNNMGTRAKSKLKFTAEQYANATTGINVECAYLQEDIEYLKSRKKLAFVKNPGGAEGKIIYLNCYDQSPDELVLNGDWKNVLEALMNGEEMSTTAKVLVIHEVFRTAGLETSEGDYNLSSSLKSAQIEQISVSMEQIREMISGTNKRCQIRVNKTRKCDGNSLAYDALEMRLYGHSGKFYEKDVLISRACNMRRWGTDIRSAIAITEGYIMDLNTDDGLSRSTLRVLGKSTCFDNR